ncbi:MAG: UPF0182 family membrane protein [Nocardioidaceae bacterium]
MSGIFDDGDETARPARRRSRIPSKRPRALWPTLAIVVLLVVFISIFVEIWTSKLWFSSLGFGGVFTKVLVTRIGLFIVFGVAFAGIVAGNVALAYRMRPILISDGYRNPTVERYQDTLDPIRRWVIGAFAAILFLFAGASASGRWPTYLLWRNGVPFGQTDVYFHRDIGFYVFGYPWYRFLVSFAFTALIIALIATAVTHYLYGGIRLQAKRGKVTPGAQVQLSVLIGFFMLMKAVAYWLDRYGLAVHQGSLFTGVNYADAHAVLPSKNILAIIALICALLFFGNVIRPGWMLPLLGFGLLVLSAILIGGIWPAIVERFQVKPSEPDKESAYIARNIAATRDAFGINDITTVHYPGVTTETPQQIKQAADALPGVRLIDPKLVAPAFEQLQQQRGFYTMPDVLDVDRYAFGGQQPPRDVVIAARELNLNGLRPDQRNWNNDHTVYTHGYGVVAAYGDQRSPVGEPVWAERNLPSVGALGNFQQGIYFGENEPPYSIVGAPPGTPPFELNIPETNSQSGQDQNSTYQGTGGVRIGSTFDRLLYAAKFWDSSIFLSGRVNSDSRIIYDRDPRQMVEKVAPWLTVDGDAYPAVVNGRLLWVLDGYTTTPDYPMSNIVDLSQATNDSLTARTKAVAGHQTDNINYIRNSVKATVDAYNGTVTLYQWDTQDPILKAWMHAFPGSVQPRSAISSQLLAHLRYPEDLFKVQREMLSTYHITNPKTFYGGSENWRVPQDPTVTSSVIAQPPFYLTVKLPGGQSNFALSSVYVPQSRDNLASFLSVDSNPTSSGYGKLTLLELPSDSTVSGPSQMANKLSNDPVVTRDLLPFTRQEAEVLKGNLLTLPVGNEMLYAQPVYTFRRGPGSYPILQYVLVSIGEKVGIGRSFDDALNRALGLSSTQAAPPPSTGNQQPGGGGSPGTGTGNNGSTDAQLVSKYLANARASFADAQAALSRGDLGAYQQANKDGLAWLDRAIALRNSSATTPPAGSTPSPSGGTPTPSGTPNTSGGTPGSIPPTSTNGASPP